MKILRFNLYFGINTYENRIKTYQNIGPFGMFLYQIQKGDEHKGGDFKRW